ncbi:MAG: Ig-like domain-containing protein, partial [Bacteroidota bacterium]|nr:Ig-like domain-containing protein [Bacteroidota bacterium]
LITSPYSEARFSPGQKVTATGTGDNLSWSISCINCETDMIASGTGSDITFTVPVNFTKNNMIRITLSGDGNITEQVHAMASSGEDFYEQNGIVSMEAENYISQEGYNLVNRSDASGNLAMQAGSDNGSLNYIFTLDNGGLWYIWIRTYATASENNGLYLRLDGRSLKAPAGHPYVGVRDIYLKKHGWCWKPEWQGAGHGKHEGPVTMNATAGTHTLSIYKRQTEDPVIDKILLTRTDTAPADSIYGPEETSKISMERNIAPVAKDKMVQTGQNKSKYIQLLYEDPDNGPGPYIISIVKQAANGSLSGTGNDQTYTPNKGFSGKDSFEWKVSDGKDDSNIATVTIHCAPSSQGNR